MTFQDLNLFQACHTLKTCCKLRTLRLPTACRLPKQDRLSGHTPVSSDRSCGFELVVMSLAVTFRHHQAFVLEWAHYAASTKLLQELLGKLQRSLRLQVAEHPVNLSLPCGVTRRNLSLSHLLQTSTSI